MTSTITRLVLAITSRETGETLERWQFDIIKEDEQPAAAPTAGSAGSASKSKPKEKTEKEVQAEIREIMKQITASVTFLPMLEEECESTSSSEPVSRSDEASVQAPLHSLPTLPRKIHYLFPRPGPTPTLT